MDDSITEHSDSVPKLSCTPWRRLGAVATAVLLFLCALAFIPVREAICPREDWPTTGAGWGTAPYPGRLWTSWRQPEDSPAGAGLSLAQGGCGLSSGDTGQGTAFLVIGDDAVLGSGQEPCLGASLAEMLAGEGAPKGCVRCYGAPDYSAWQCEQWLREILPQVRTQFLVVISTHNDGTLVAADDPSLAGGPWRQTLEHWLWRGVLGRPLVMSLRGQARPFRATCPQGVPRLNIKAYRHSLDNMAMLARAYGVKETVFVHLPNANSEHKVFSYKSPAADSPLSPEEKLDRIPYDPESYEYAFCKQGRESANCFDAFSLWHNRRYLDRAEFFDAGDSRRLNGKGNALLAEGIWQYMQSEGLL